MRMLIYALYISLDLLNLLSSCLNTVLRKEKPSVFCSRTCRLSKAKRYIYCFLHYTECTLLGNALSKGVEYLQELSLQVKRKRT